MGDRSSWRPTAPVAAAALLGLVLLPAVGRAAEEREAELAEVERILGKDMSRVYPAFEASAEYRQGLSFADYLHGKCGDRGATSPWCGSS